MDFYAVWMHIRHCERAHEDGGGLIMIARRGGSTMDAASDNKVSIAPMLSVRGGAKAVDFYKAAFGVRELFRMDDPSGAVVAELTVGGARFWVADESPENLNFSPESVGGSTARMVMVVDDPDMTFARAVEAGAKVVWPVAENYGWRLGRVADPYGHHWEIGKPLGSGAGE
jgi:PhnB protein